MAPERPVVVAGIRSLSSSAPPLASPALQSLPASEEARPDAKSDGSGASSPRSALPLTLLSTAGGGASADSGRALSRTACERRMTSFAWAILAETSEDRLVVRVLPGLSRYDPDGPVRPPLIDVRVVNRDSVGEGGDEARDEIADRRPISDDDGAPIPLP